MNIEDVYGPLGCDNMKKLSHVFGVISSNLFVWGFFLIRTKENERRDNKCGMIV